MSNVTCKSLIVKWSRWNRFSDIGDLNVVAYRLEERINSTVWRKIKFFDSSNDTEYTYHKEFENDWGSYEWKVMSIWSDNNKNQEGLFSPITTHTQRKDCIGNFLTYKNRLKRLKRFCLLF